MTPLGSHIIRLRNARGWTRMDLANAAGLPYTTVRNIEKGLRSKKPVEANIRALAAALENGADVMLVLAGYGPAPKRTPEQTIIDLDALGGLAPNWREAIERVKTEMSAADQELALEVLLAHLSAAQRRKGSE